MVDVGNEQLFAFRRTLDADSVAVVVNVTKSAQAFKLGDADRSLPAFGWLVEAA